MRFAVQKRKTAIYPAVSGNLLVAEFLRNRDVDTGLCLVERSYDDTLGQLLRDWVVG